jgi:hypothetical protein
MKTLIKVLVTFSILLLTGSSFSCSGSNSAVEPPIENQQSDIPVLPDEDSNRSMVAAYDVSIDPEGMNLEITPSSRIANYHFNLSGLFPKVLAITGYGFDPSHNNDFYADIRISHPFQSSGIDGFDPRVIALLPARDGVSMYYPSSNVLANNKALLNPDAYTRLWDSVNPGIVGNTNPFKAYFKDVDHRRWSSSGQTSQTQRFYIDLDGFGGPAQFTLVVDVSTNYPNTPQPVIDNASEPVAMSAVVTSEMTPAGGQATIEVTLLDWQGSNEIRSRIECPNLFSGFVTLNFNRNGTNPDEYIFSRTFNNTLGASPGDYDVLVTGWDVNFGNHIYITTKAHVGLAPSSWVLDPLRANIDLSTLDVQYKPRPGSDLGACESTMTDYDGIVMYTPDDMVVKMDLNLTQCNIHGDAYLPNDGDPTNPHPTPDVFPTNRIDIQANGVMVQSWNDGHLGAGPDLAGQWQREDALIGIMEPFGFNWTNFLIGGIPDMSNDNTATPQYDESLERPRVADVYDEADNGNGNYVVGGIWSGTTVWDEATGNTFNPIGVMGGIKVPYWDEPNWLITMDWGLWIFTGPPSNEIVSADASQDENFPFQYWGYSGVMTGPALVAAYDKVGGTVSIFQPSDLEAKLLDVQLIPTQDPPLQANGITQEIDWIAVLLDNQTIEIIDPFVNNGQIVDIIDCGMLEGDVKYLDTGNLTASLYVSHTDGTTPYCSVFTYNGD